MGFKYDPLAIIGGKPPPLPVQGYIALRKRPPPWGPRHRHTVGSYGLALSYERGAPVRAAGNQSEKGDPSHSTEEG